MQRLQQIPVWAMLLFAVLPVLAQGYGPDNSGIKKERNEIYAFTNATLHVDPNTTLDNATLLIRNDRVVKAGKSVEIPGDARVIDAKGKHIYPSFVELFSDFAMKDVKRATSGGGRSAQYDPTREGYYWNDHIRPDQQASENLDFDQETAKTLRSQGFGAVNTHVDDGIARGTGALIALSDEDPEARRILAPVSGSYYSFQKSVQSRQSYPTSLMGSLALLRQLHYDLDWYSKHARNKGDRALAALEKQKGLVSFLQTGNSGDAVHAARLGKEVGKNFVIMGTGYEFETIEELKSLNARLVLPLNFPDAYDVSDPFNASRIPLNQLRFWNQAPTNPGEVSKAGIPMALTSNGLKKAGDFLSKVREAISYGLSEEAALQALTTTPAQFLGQQGQLGALREGYLANFILVSGPVFTSESKILENWVQGRRHTVTETTDTDIRGDYTLKDGGKPLNFKITGSPEKPKVAVTQGENKLTAEITLKDSWVHIRYKDSLEEAFNRFSARSLPGEVNLRGLLTDSQGAERETMLARSGEIESDEKKKTEDSSPETREIVPLTFPNTAYGRTEKPRAQDMVFRNATVWTGYEILENTDVWVEDGLIRAVGKDLKARGALEVDATGKHLTAGIIDEHSHIGLHSVNESGHNSSAEVRMKEVIDAKDVNLYRNLAGGVTTIQQLHGSANPIGGRSSIIKLKWGESAQGLIFDKAPGFIKFALGENVKQSNWSGGRFPQTRMGVEQLFVNYFSRAAAYQAVKDSGKPYRKDEEMEVIAEIINSRRFISCHSYVQSEINMLMKVADRFGFRVNTFTHILEGYKVADKMAQHGVGGSTFSDWWAYKYEVNDAIPYNAAIMSSQGVTVAINSDDAEMSRRLNQEAAKTVKYGGMSEIEAWKTVTLNPAKLLHVDGYVGSIEKGKMADLVLWSDHPLSMRSKAEKTMIEGVVYFDLETDRQLREGIASERKLLIDQMLDAKKKGKPTQAPSNRRRGLLTCNTL